VIHVRYTRTLSKKCFLGGRTVGRQRSAVLAHAWQPNNSGVFSFVRFVLALQDAAAQSASARYYSTGSSSHNFLNSGPEKTPVRYVLAPASAVEQVRERVISFNPLSAFFAEMRECVLRPFSTLLAFLQSHYLTRRAEA
jgi:hypothetical protein